MFNLVLVCLVFGQLFSGCLGLFKFPDINNPPKLEPVEDTIRYVFIISRSGNRAPIFDPYSTDNAAIEDFKKYWGVEKGELTESGEALMTTLGKTLYHRYEKFLPKLTSKIVTSHKSLRTERSAKLVADQLFGERLKVDTNTEHWDKYTMIISSNKDDQPCVRYHKAKVQCSSWQDLYKELSQSYNPKGMLKVTQPVREFTGVKEKMTLMNLIKIYDTFEMKISDHKKVFSHWILWRLGEDVLTKAKINFATGGGSCEANPFTTGPLLHQIFKEFESCTTGCRGMHLHVTHSVMVSALLQALHLEDVTPFVGVTVMVEIHEGNMVKVLVYFPISLNDHYHTGTLYQAIDQNSLATAMSELCGNKNSQRDVQRSAVTCNISHFQSTFTVWSPEEWKKQCSL